MKIYAVGGCIRDYCLGFTPKDFDFVVVGSTPQQMEQLGYQQVGADFPVYLDNYGNELALARTERKTGSGYTGFEVDAKGVTLEEDLFRRDLTINAMACEVLDWGLSNQPILDLDNIIDPYNGLSDLEAGVLRPVSEHFKEDPVRILRAGRFAARYGFNFTTELVNQGVEMQRSGELDHLVPERVWTEVHRTMKEPHPSRFFELLNRIGAIENIFKTKSVRWYELDRIEDRDVRFILLFQQFKNADDVERTLKNELKVPSHYFKCVKQFITIVNGKHKRTGTDLLDILNILSAFNNSTTQKSVVKALGRVHYRTFSTSEIKQAIQMTSSINYNVLSGEQRRTLRGKQIGDTIAEYRAEAIDWILHK